DPSHLAMLVPRYQWELSPMDPKGAGLRRVTCPASPVNEAAYRRAFADLDHDRPDFIWVMESSENAAFREVIVGLVNGARIPALYPLRAYVDLGGLISYGWDFDEIYKHLADQMDMLLRGAAGVRSTLLPVHKVGTCHQSEDGQGARRYVAID